MARKKTTANYSLLRDLQRFGVEALCLLMLLCGAPLQSLESVTEPISLDTANESNAQDEPSWVDSVLETAGDTLDAAQDEVQQLATSLVQLPRADAFGLLFNATHIGASGAGSSSGSAPPSPPKDDARPSKDYDLASLAAGFSDKNALDAVPLLPGWNQVSLPEVPASGDPATVLAAIGGSYQKVYTYNGCDAADPWKVYDPNDLSASDLTTIGVEQGLLIDATAAVSLPSDGALPDSTTIQLCTGWNLIGFPSAFPRHVKSALAPILDKVVRVYAFDPFDLADNWKFYEASAPAWASDLDTMLPGMGYWVLVTEDVQLEIKNVGDAPSIAFTSPQDLDVITAPTEIQGTVASDLLDNWQLRYRGVGENDWIDLATGNYPVQGKLGNFDPTLLLNGMYELELVATDLQGQQVTDSIALVVEGNMKIGHFTLSFVDLAIPLSGLDIQVVRTYDSRQRHLQGDFGSNDFAGNDFGYGWSLDIRQGSYRNNRPPGDGWRIPPTEGPWGLPCSTVQELKSHLTTVRLSDQEVYRFRLTVKNPGTIIGGCIGRAEFEFVDGPVPGATLEILGNDQVLHQNNIDELRDPNSFAFFVPEDVKLTTRDGRIFHLDLADGVTHLEDLNGNTLEITPEGITHSSGRGIEFERDAEGRIERIVDPMGNANVYAYDDAGDLVSFTDRIGAVTTFAYADGHYLEDIVNALGVRVVRTEYGDDGRMVRVIDAAGKVVALDHNLDARREVVTNRLGFVRVMEYDGRGNVVREVDEAGAATLRTFDGRDNLLTETNPLGHTTTYAYSPDQAVQSIRDPLGHTISIAYGDCRLPLTLTDALGQVTSNTYSPSNLLLSSQDPLGNVTTFTYGSGGNLSSLTDALGLVSAFQFDAVGHLRQQTDALGNVVAFDYDANGNRIRETRTRTLPSGESEILTTSFQYDALNRLITVTAPDGSVSRTDYDALGRVTRQVDPLGREILYQYDGRGLPVQTAYADGTSRQVQYDNEGRRIASVDPAGRVTQFFYDPVGRLIRTVYPGSDPGSSDEATESMAYDAAGQLIASTDALGNTTTTTYDAAGRRTRVTDPLGHTSQFAYDANNRLRQITDALGNTSEHQYDALGRVKAVVAPDGSSSQTLYDALGRTIETIDPAGKRTRFGYNAVSRMVAVTDALDQVTAYAYNELGHFVQQTDANGHSTRYETDTLGRQTARILPDGARETFSYDAAGQLTRHTDFNGAARTFTYDFVGRLLQRQYPDGGRHAFTYTPSGQRATVTDQRGGVTTFEYDARNRPIRRTDPNGHQLEFGYDAAGNRTQLSATVGTEAVSVLYSFDALHRIATVTDPRGGLYTFAYDANGQPERLSYPNGVVTTWEHDALQRLTFLETQNSSQEVLQSYQYTLAPSGHRLRIDEHDGTSRSYTYDNLWRLTSDRVTDATEALIYEQSFDYDPVGNRLASTWTTAEEPPVVQTTTYDSRDRITAINGQSLAWDAAGRILSKPASGSHLGATYTWGFDDRLLSTELADGTTAATAYDADGTRVQTAQDTGQGVEVVKYLVDDSGWLSHAVGDITHNQTGGDGLDSFYVRAGDQLLGLINDSTGDRFYHLDGLGSVRSVSDSTGVQTTNLDYTAFGERLPGSAGSQVYGFAGEPWSTVAGLAYHRARWMDPGLGRFLSRDPFRGWLGSPASQHAYGYAHQNPVSLSDPSGLSTSIGGVLAVSAAVGIITAIVSPPLASLFGRQITTLEAVEAGGWAFLFTAVALVAPPVAMAIALVGFDRSLKLYLSVWSRPSTPAQKSVATGLLALSTLGIGYAGAQMTSSSQTLSVPASVAAVESRSGAQLNRVPSGVRQDWPQLAEMLKLAAKGKGNFSVGSATRNQAQAMGEAWVGPGYRVSSDGVAIISTDGLRQYRQPSFKPRQSRTQANFETRQTPRGEWQSNGHLDIVD